MHFCHLKAHISYPLVLLWLISVPAPPVHIIPNLIMIVIIPYVFAMQFILSKWSVMRMSHYYDIFDNGYSIHYKVLQYIYSSVVTHVKDLIEQELPESFCTRSFLPPVSNRAWPWTYHCVGNICCLSSDTVTGKVNRITQFPGPDTLFYMKRSAESPLFLTLINQQHCGCHLQGFEHIHICMTSMNQCVMLCLLLATNHSLSVECRLLWCPGLIFHIRLQPLCGQRPCFGESDC